MAVSDFYNAWWPDFICISAHYCHYKYVMMMMMMMMS